MGRSLHKKRNAWASPVISSSVSGGSPRCCRCHANPSLIISSLGFFAMRSLSENRPPPTAAWGAAFNTAPSTPTPPRSQPAALSRTMPAASRTVASRHDGSTGSNVGWSRPHPLAGSANRLHDASANGRRQARPYVDDRLQVGSGSGLDGGSCSDCTGFCTALPRIGRFSAVFAGTCNPVGVIELACLLGPRSAGLMGKRCLECWTGERGLLPIGPDHEFT